MSHTKNITYIKALLKEEVILLGRREKNLAFKIWDGREIPVSFLIKFSMYY